LDSKSKSETIKKYILTPVQKQREIICEDCDSSTISNTGCKNRLDRTGENNKKATKGNKTQERLTEKNNEAPNRDTADNESDLVGNTVRHNG